MDGRDFLGPICALEENIIDSLLLGNRDDLSLLLEFQEPYDEKEFNQLINMSSLNDPSSNQVMVMMFDALRFTRSRRDEFYDIYGVNYEITREIALKSLSEYYKTTDRDKFECIDRFYLIIKGEIEITAEDND